MQYTQETNIKYNMTHWRMVVMFVGLVVLLLLTLVNFYNNNKMNGTDPNIYACFINKISASGTRFLLFFINEI